MTFEVPPAAPLWVVRLVARLFLFALRQPEESLPCDREAEKGRGKSNGLDDLRRPVRSNQTSCRFLAQSNVVGGLDLWYSPSVQVFCGVLIFLLPR